MFSYKYISLYFLCTFVSALGLFRFYGFIENPIPLGYDPGIYKNMFLEFSSLLPHIDFSLLNNYNSSGFPPLMGYWGNIMHLIGFSPDFLLTYGIGFFSIFTSLCLYVFLRPSGKTIAIFGACIFLLSVIQYQVFWWGYYKQILSTIFMILALSGMQREKFSLAAIMCIATCTIHRPTGLFLAIVLGVYMLVSLFSKQNINYKKYVYVFIITLIVSLIVYIPVLSTQILSLIQPVVTTVGAEGKSGTFFDQAAFGKLNFLIILLSIFGLYKKLSEKQFDLYTVGYFVGMFWVGAGLFFYNRMLISYDIFIICLAAYGLHTIYISRYVYVRLIVVIFFIAQGLYYAGYVHNFHNPLISQQEFAAIQKLDTITSSPDRVMVSDASYSPWLHGYTKNSTIAPGLFESNIWDIHQWREWWFGDDEVKCSMIQDYKKEGSDIYWWIGEHQATFKQHDGSCFQEVLSGETYKVYKIIF